MGIRSVILAAGLVAGPGCIHIHTDGDGKVKSVEMKVSPAADEAKAGSPAKVDPAVKPASAAVPAPAPSGPTLPKLPFAGSPANSAIEIGAAWEPRLAYLPDPARGGATGVGLLGRMFLFGAGPKMPFAQADGKLTVEMFDESPRPGVPAQSVRQGSWTFDKETLRRLVTTDERFGKCYALFLPWPDYRPDITRVKLTVKYEPEHGFPLYTAPYALTIDTTLAGGNGAAAANAMPLTQAAAGGPAGLTSLLGGPVTAGPGAAANPAAAAGFGMPPVAPQPAAPMPFAPIPMTPAAAAAPVPPVAFPAPTPMAVPVSPGGPPAGLPPIAFTVPAR